MEPKIRINGWRSELKHGRVVKERWKIFITPSSLRWNLGSSLEWDDNPRIFVIITKKNNNNERKSMWSTDELWCHIFQSLSFDLNWTNITFYLSPNSLSLTDRKFAFNLFSCSRSFVKNLIYSWIIFSFFYCHDSLNFAHFCASFSSTTFVLIIVVDVFSKKKS